MKFIEYNPVNEKGNCIIRAFTKLLDKDYFIVKEELLDLAQQLSFIDYREIEVFEKYLRNYNADTLTEKDMLVKNLKLGKGRYAIFCYKGDFYHMVAIIDDVIYDKDDRCLDLIVLKIYKLNSK